MASDKSLSPDAIHKEEAGLSTVGAFDKAREAKLIRKIDLRLLPILGALYSISFIDRGNVIPRTQTDQTSSTDSL